MENIRKRGSGQAPSSRQIMYEEFQPSFVWSEDSNSHVLLVDLPGFTKEDVKLQVDNSGKITISGEKRVSDNKYSKFRQVLDAPENSNIEKVSGKFEHGLLFVILPRKEPQNMIASDSSNKEEKPPKKEAETVMAASEGSKKEEKPPKKEAEKVMAASDSNKIEEKPPKKEVEKKEEPQKVSASDSNKKEEKPPKKEVERKEEAQKVIGIGSDSGKKEEKLPILTEAKMAKKEVEKKEEAQKVIASDGSKKEEKKKEGVAGGVETKGKGRDTVKFEKKEGRTEKSKAERDSVMEEEEEEEWGINFMDKVIDHVSKNRAVIATAIAAFSLGMYISRKFR